MKKLQLWPPRVTVLEMRPFSRVLLKKNIYTCQHTLSENSLQVCYKQFTISQTILLSCEIGLTVECGLVK